MDVPRRPSDAIETIVYFCTAELLANAAKHSGARRVDVQLAQREDTLLLKVSDDGWGGATSAPSDTDHRRVLAMLRCLRSAG